MMLYLILLYSVIYVECFLYTYINAFLIPLIITFLFYNFRKTK